MTKSMFYIYRPRHSGEAIFKLVNDDGDELSVAFDDSSGALAHLSRARMAVFPTNAHLSRGSEVLHPTAMEFVQAAAEHLGYYLVSKDRELANAKSEAEVRAQALAEALEVIRKVCDASASPDAATECLEAVEALAYPRPLQRYRLAEADVRCRNPRARAIREAMISDLADKWYALEAEVPAPVAVQEQQAIVEAMLDLGGSIVYPHERG